MRLKCIIKTNMKEIELNYEKKKIKKSTSKINF